MGRKLISWVIFSIALTLILNDVNAQAPVPGTVAFKSQTRTQTNSYSLYDDFVPASDPGPLIGLHFRLLQLSTAVCTFHKIPYSGNKKPFLDKINFNFP